MSRETTTPEIEAASALGMMVTVRRTLPSGTVTFLYTDVEGSTKLLHELGAQRYAAALAEHRRIVRAAFAARDGVEVDTQGDAFFVAFPTAPGALSAAGEMTEALAPGPIRVRIGLHTGTPFVTDEGYVGEDVHRAARIAAAGHGGQVLVSASTAALLEPAALHDLGEHRFKDLSAPERVYQLGDTEFPALKSLYRTNLPIPATPFLGRERELTEVAELLAHDDVRLLTLTGPGGTGKTRLALQAAAAAADAYPGGVFWVPLAPLRDPRLVIETAAQTLGAKDALAEHVADKRLLLLFDNFEHITDAATELTPLLAACPNLDLLVTSRERLRVRGEQTWPVPPLAPNDASELFTARARAIDPAFVAGPDVAELCTHLDELPLAIELAAARTAVFSPVQLRERLSQRLDLLKGDRDADPRQQTLRATIEWSHDLLDPAERQLFRRLGLFPGGCTYDTAERLAEADPDTLQSLLDKSLLRKRETAHEPRYWMLETIREYATEQLDASGEADRLRRSHADYYLALAEEAEPHLRAVALRGPIHGPGTWLDGLEVEHDNLRAALDWLETAGETQQVMRMTGSLAEFWFAKDHFGDLRRRLPAALAADERPTLARATTLIGASDMSAMGGDPASATRCAEEALDLSRLLGDRPGVADALWRLGAGRSMEGDHLAARPLLEESLALFRELDDPDSTMSVTRSLAHGHLERGELEQARALYAGNLLRARQLGNELLEARTLGALALIAAEGDRPEEALAPAREHLLIARDLGRFDLSVAFSRAAYVLARVGRTVGAVRILSCSEALIEELWVPEPWVVRQNERTTGVARELLGDEAFTEAWEQGQALTADEAVALALDELG